MKPTASWAQSSCLRVNIVSSTHQKRQIKFQKQRISATNVASTTKADFNATLKVKAEKWNSLQTETQRHEKQLHCDSPLERRNWFRILLLQVVRIKAYYPKHFKSVNINVQLFIQKSNHFFITKSFLTIKGEPFHSRANNALLRTEILSEYFASSTRVDFQDEL